MQTLLRFGRAADAGAVIVTITTLLLLTSCASAGFTEAPDRGGPLFGGTKDPCPPQKQDSNGKWVKVPPDNSADKNVMSHPDGRKDWFEGQWKFQEGDRDLIVTKWCVNTKTPHDDYYTVEIQASTGDTERTLVPAGDEQTCAFTNGKNEPSGFQGKPFDKLPSRIDWISANPHTEFADTAPLVDSRKVIWEIKPDQSDVVKGVIEKATDGTITLSGSFKVAGGYKTADALTATERDEVVSDFKKERAALAEKYSDSIKPDPPGDPTVCLD